MFAGKKISEFFPWAESKEGKKWYGGFKTKLEEKMPGGESYNDLRNRVERICEKIIREEKGKNVFVMTHGKIKIMMLAYLLRKDYMKFKKKHKIENTAISVIHVKDDGNHRARLINNTRHLAGD